MFSTLFSVSKIYFIVFGLVTAFGGVMGYVKADSKASLVAGGVSGALLVTGALLIPRAWTVGAVLELIVCLLLAGRFAPALLAGKLNPAAYVVPLAVIGIVLAAMMLFSRGAHP